MPAFVEVTARQTVSSNPDGSQTLKPDEELKYENLISVVKAFIIIITFFLHVAHKI